MAVICEEDSITVPGKKLDRPFEAHQWLMNRMEYNNLENLDMATLAADRAYEFAFISALLRLQGATGSPRNPIAVR